MSNPNQSPLNQSPYFTIAADERILYENRNIVNLHQITMKSLKSFLIFIGIFGIIILALYFIFVYFDPQIFEGTDNYSFLWLSLTIIGVGLALYFPFKHQSFDFLDYGRYYRVFTKSELESYEFVDIITDRRIIHKRVEVLYRSNKRTANQQKYITYNHDVAILNLIDIYELQIKALPGAFSLKSYTAKQNTPQINSSGYHDLWNPESFLMEIELKNQGLDEILPELYKLTFNAPNNQIQPLPMKIKFEPLNSGWVIVPLLLAGALFILGKWVGGSI